MVGIMDTTSNKKGRRTTSSSSSSSNNQKNKNKNNKNNNNNKKGSSLKLNPETKEFIPHNNNNNNNKPVLKATAPEFHPHPDDTTTLPKKVVSAWGSKTNEAVLRAAPPPSQQQHHHHHQNQHQNQHRNNKNNNRRGGGNNNNNNNNNDKNNNRHGSKNNKGGNNKRQNKNNKGDPEKNFRPIANVELYRLGDGNTEEQKKGIHRMDASELLALRLLYLDAAPMNKDDFNPPEYALWDSDTRVQDIRAMSLLGSAAAVPSANNNNNNGNNHNNAPAEEPEVAPLVINEETRWKAKVFSTNKDTKTATNTEDSDNTHPKEDSTEVILKKSLLILNKLSFTKFDKLSQTFIDSGIFTTEETLKGAISLIVDKAQLEPHFSSMYAQLCHKLSLYDKHNKKFKKLLLTRCQEEFEQDLASKITQACKQQGATTNDDNTTTTTTDEMKAQELDYYTNLCRKKYLGHMRFIGELYKHDLISIRVMIFCLPFLLDAEENNNNNSDDVNSNNNNKNNTLKIIDEEKLECFSKLMTTIGHSLEMQSKALENVGKKDSANKLAKCWNDVDDLIHNNYNGSSTKISNRVKFMLQDLMDLKNNGWITRRKEETAKTLNEIHREVAKEEKRASKRSNSAANLKALGDASQQSSSSRGNIASIRSSSVKVQVDEDGFMTVVSNKSNSSNNMMKRNLSMCNLSRSNSDSFPSTSSDKNIKFIKRSSTIGDTAITKRQSKEIRQAAATTAATYSKQPPSSPTPTPPPPPNKKEVEVVKLKTPEECSELVKSILKEYFFTNDLTDTMLSLEELAGPNDDDLYKDRVIALFETGILQVLEMKNDDVQKLITLIQRFCDKNIIIPASSSSSTDNNNNKKEYYVITQSLHEPLELLIDIIIDAPLACK